MSLVSGETLVYIGLGSNLGEPRSNLLHGLEAMAALPGFSPGAVSSPYVTAPVGPQDQPPFVNAVVSGSWQGPAGELLRGLLGIEDKMGRKRERHWGPRVLDLDLLLFGREIVEEEGLTVPHPQMANRAFVLVPLMELAPELELPVWRETPGRLLQLLPAQERAAQSVEKTTWA